MDMYVCVCVCMYVYMYACMHACMYVCVYACMHACVCVSICIHVCMYTSTHTCVYLNELIESYVSTGVARCLGGGREGVRVRFRMPRWFDRWIMYWGLRQVRPFVALPLNTSVGDCLFLLTLEGEMIHDVLGILASLFRDADLPLNTSLGNFNFFAYTAGAFVPSRILV